MVRACLVVMAVLAAACGGAAEEAAPGEAAPEAGAAGTPTASAEMAPATEATPTEAAAAQDGPVANACPPEGCQVELTDVAPEGEELRLTWEANFLPDPSRNHVHVYWDTYTAEQVSSDAEARGVEQGEWVPTGAYPTYVTDGVVSVANRGDSTTICVTAAERDHAVLDPSQFDCEDVSDLLGG